jgi:hypothetical protein
LQDATSPPSPDLDNSALYEAADTWADTLGAGLLARLRDNRDLVLAALDIEDTDRG